MRPKPWVAIVIMLGDNASQSTAPTKPWEISGPSVNPVPNSLSNTFAPPPPPPPMGSPPSQDSNFYQNTSNWFGSTGPSGGYYNSGGYSNRFGYPSSYNSGYSSYSSPFYMNNGPYGGGPPAPGSYITSSLENTTRPLFDSLNHILQAVNHVACFIDSTVFAVWTSVTAAGSIVTAVKSIRTVYLRKWIESFKRFMVRAKIVLATSSGRRKMILLASIVASIPLLFKVLQTILKMDTIDESSIVLRDTYLETTESASSTDGELSSKAVFVRALYAYEPNDKSTYLSFNPGDVILISKDDASKLNESAPVWIAGKMKDGSIGYFPSNYVNVIK